MFEYKQLGKFTYHILPNMDNINHFLQTWLRKEWETDHSEDPDQPWTLEWLDLLSLMKFELKKINRDSVNLRKDLMDYKTETYNFQNELNDRVADMEESILRGSSIEPLIVNGENMELMDGYTRYKILKKYDQERVYAYVGTLK
ncbi:MAG: hypothetical protein ACXAES_12060 [Promethearchaeota archaeon]|jgi:hypothetical protein